MSKQYADSPLALRAFEPKSYAIEFSFRCNEFNINTHYLELRRDHRFLKRFSALFEKVVDLDPWTSFDSYRSS